MGQPIGDEDGIAGSAVSEPDIHPKETFPVLVIGAIGVVYGDIGTSPIYAFREAIRAASSDCA